MSSLKFSSALNDYRHRTDVPLLTVQDKLLPATLPLYIAPLGLNFIPQREDGTFEKLAEPPELVFLLR